MVGIDADSAGEASPEWADWAVPRHGAHGRQEMTVQRVGSGGA